MLSDSEPVLNTQPMLVSGDVMSGHYTPRPTSRRAFLGALSLAGVSLSRAQANALKKRICLFTDHLSGFPLEAVAVMLAGLGVAGPDLTVRPGGLVAPERVSDELPRAAEIFRKKHGMRIAMITTAIRTASEGEPILRAAVGCGVKFYKLGYSYYDDMSRWQATREDVAAQLKEIAALNEELGIHGGYHTHSGPNVGGLLWDAVELLENVDPRWMGIYFDTAHSVIEGGKNGWNYGLRRAASRITMASIKDFVWEKHDGQWRTRWVPLGSGMVPFTLMMPLLLRIPFAGPVSLHVEYNPGGISLAERYRASSEAAKRDLAKLREYL